MAEFTSLATSYVLADDEAEQQRIARQAAEAIQNAPRKSSAVLGWAQSINQWMPNGDDGDSDVIVRAKALGFLAATLEVLDDDVLRVEQVEHLIKFFGAMFAIDHKAGILAAATALHRLCSMAHFRPAMAASVLDYVTKLGDDFRLQVPTTRRAIYDLVGLLVRSDAVLASLGETAGPSALFLVDLLQLCRSERDPDNLLRWFAILRRVLERYGQTPPPPPPQLPLSPEMAADVFKAASDYFPISMRSSATPAGTTVDDLKTALRGVFAAACSRQAATPVFDFLLQKMDQGDALTVAVKVDILRTIQACVQGVGDDATDASDATTTVVPHASRIWNSLKYEVRHGDVPETIDGTLRVVEAISKRLNSVGDTSIDDFVGVVLADCTGDLANATFARPAGMLLTSTMRGGYRAYNLAIGSVVATVKKDLQQAQTASHTRDLVGVLNSVLNTRQALVDSVAADATTATTDELHSHDAAVVDLLDGVYLRLWNNTFKETPANTQQQGQDPVVLVEVIRGLAALIVQRGPAAAATDRPLLCGPAQCMQIVGMLVPCIVAPKSDDLSPTETQTLAHEALAALQAATAVYPDGFALVVDRVVAASITDLVATPSLLASPSTLAAARDALARVAYIGCSTILEKEGSEGQALDHFRVLTQALVAALEQLASVQAPFAASTAVLSGIYGAALNLRDAFVQSGVVVVADKAKKASSSAGAVAEPKAVVVKLFQDYLRDATALVQRLLVRATASTPDGITLSADFETNSSNSDDQDQYLHQLAAFTTFVVRDLDEAQQKEARLAEAAFSLFHADYRGPRAFFRDPSGRVEVLSLGILKGLWPATVASLSDLGVSPLNLLDDYAALDRLPPRPRLVRNTIATVVANKYAAAAATSGSPGKAAWLDTIAAVQQRLESAAGPAVDVTMTPSRFARLVAISASAFARLDRDAKVLAHLLVSAPAAHAAHAAQSAATPAAAEYANKAAQQMARLLGGLVVPDRTLATDDHAVVKSIYKQWVYGQTVKTLLPLAFPRRTVGGGSDDDKTDEAARRTSTIHTIVILSLVRGMPFSVYEDDISSTDSNDTPSLVRVLVAATTTLVPQWADVAVALRVLSAVLAANRADAVRSHLKTVVDAAIRVFSAPTAPPPARKAALSLVAQLPTHYDQGLLLPYEPRLARAMATACGDGVREIRDMAQVARGNWSKVGE